MIRYTNYIQTGFIQDIVNILKPKNLSSKWVFWYALWLMGLKVGRRFTLSIGDIEVDDCRFGMRFVVDKSGLGIDNFNNFNNQLEVIKEYRLLFSHNTQEEVESEKVYTADELLIMPNNSGKVNPLVGVNLYELVDRYNNILEPFGKETQATIKDEEAITYLHNLIKKSERYTDSYRIKFEEKAIYHILRTALLLAVNDHRLEINKRDLIKANSLIKEVRDTACVLYNEDIILDTTIRAIERVRRMLQRFPNGVEHSRCYNNVRMLIDIASFNNLITLLHELEMIKILKRGNAKGGYIYIMTSRLIDQTYINKLYSSVN